MGLLSALEKGIPQGPQGNLPTLPSITQLTCSLIATDTCCTLSAKTRKISTVSPKLKKYLKFFQVNKKQHFIIQKKKLFNFYYKLNQSIILKINAINVYTNLYFFFFILYEHNIFFTFNLKDSFSFFLFDAIMYEKLINLIRQ
jgi:hypothetical protein